MLYPIEESNCIKKKGSLGIKFQENGALKSNSRKTPVKGILKSRPVTPEVIVDNVNIVEKSKVVADKALNLLNPYRQQSAILAHPSV